MTGGRGEERASPALLAAIQSPKHERDVWSDDEAVAYLDARGAYAITFNATLLVLRLDARKIEVWEGFLHTPQYRMRMDDYLTAVQREIHVKDFMLRHARLLRLNANDVKWIETSKIQYENVERGGGK